MKNCQLFFFPCYTYVCSVMRSYCPDNMNPPNMKKNVYFFHILGLNLKISYQIVSLFDMYIDMGERIAGKQERPSLIIGTPK